MALVSSFPSRRERDDISVPLVVRDERFEMTTPSEHGLPSLFLVFIALRHDNEAVRRAAGMFEHAFDRVWQKLDTCHASRPCASKIMHEPSRHGMT